MLKIIVIGSPGAGKSTFARTLKDCTGIPLYYLDMVWHRPDRTNVSRDVFDAAVREIIERERWIVDGNYQRSLEMRLQACDTVFLLDYPLSVCLAGAQARIGKKREDLPWVETGLDEEFRRWILDFPGEQLPRIYELLGKYREGREIFVFKSRGEADAYLRELQMDLPPDGPQRG